VKWRRGEGEAKTKNAESLEGENGVAIGGGFGAKTKQTGGAPRQASLRGDGQTLGKCGVQCLAWRSAEK